MGQVQSLADLWQELRAESTEGSWVKLVHFMERCPGVAARCNVTGADLVEDFCARGWFKAGIRTSRRLGLNRKIGWIYHQLKLRSITAAAEREGKEVEAGRVCTTPALQLRFVKELLKVGKLKLAHERMSAWNMSFNASQSQRKRARQRYRRFFQLPKSVAIQHMASSADLRKLHKGMATWGCVGLDTESSAQGPVLLQIATSSEVYLIDLPNTKYQDFLVTRQQKLSKRKLRWHLWQMRTSQSWPSVVGTGLGTPFADFNRQTLVQYD